MLFAQIKYSYTSKKKNLFAVYLFKELAYPALAKPPFCCHETHARRMYGVTTQETKQGIPRPLFFFPGQDTALGVLKVGKWSTLGGKRKP